MPPLTYANYLDLEKLLTLQNPRSTPAEHDEMLFIIIHQTYELWFKEILHELDYLRTLLAGDDLPRAGHAMRRVLTILKVLVAQVDILETMTPLEFLSFRARLEAGSGFQSAQFRELEFVLGQKRASALHHYPPDTAERSRLEERYQAPSLWDWFVAYLARRGYGVPAAVLNRDVTQENIKQTICVPGWTRTVRPAVEYTNALKVKQMRAYHELGSPSDYQEDHLISLELGGNPTDPRNLWPEPYPRAAAVDQIENDLNAKVCNGALSLAEAQLQESALKHRDG